MSFFQSPQVAKVSKLLADLDSPSQRTAESSSRQLDEALYPQLRGLYTIDQHDKASEAHFSRVRGTAVADLLVETVANGLPKARSYALSVLTHMGDERALQLVYAALEDAEPSIRVTATGCCWILGDSGTVPVEILQ